MLVMDDTHENETIPELIQLWFEYHVHEAIVNLITYTLSEEEREEAYDRAMNYSKMIQCILLDSSTPLI